MQAGVLRSRPACAGIEHGFRSWTRFKRQIESVRAAQDAPLFEGELVRIVAGPFAGHRGPVTEVRPERAQIVIRLELGARATAVWLSPDSVQRA